MPILILRCIKILINSTLLNVSKAEKNIKYVSKKSSFQNEKHL